MITVAFDRGVQGWTSEFSFNRMNSGISLNNNYYTFYAGEIWRHNEEQVNRNTFYGIHDETEIKFIFNEEPSTVKNFKTLNFEGTGNWEVAIETNSESGQITAANFVDKEGKQYAYIRGEENRFGNLDLRAGNVKGAGLFRNVALASGVGTFQLDNIPSALGQGDIIYRCRITGGTNSTDSRALAPELVGRVSNLNRSTRTITLGDRAGIEQDPVTGAQRTFFDPTDADLCMYVKSGTAEKSGLIGFFAIVTMTNASLNEAELFSVSSEVFKSS